MKTLLKLFFLFFLLTGLSTAQSSGGGWLIDTTIIPVTCGIWWGFTDSARYPGAMDSMRAAVDGIVLDLGYVDGKPWGGTKDSQMDTLVNDYKFHVIPAAVYNKSESLFYNWVEYYSDARYTEWQVEGEFGDTSYLQHNPNIMEEDTDGDTTFIRLRPNAALGQKELIWGPYYSQYVYGLTDADTLDYARYTAKFRMKLQENDFIYHDTTFSDNPATELCIIQVTQSKLKYPNDWTFECTHVIEEDTIALGDFQQLDRFYNFKLDPDNQFYDYKLDSDACQSDFPGVPIPQANTGDMTLQSNGYDELTQRNYIQFKVIWLGNPNYLLSIDKVTVSDEKGLILMTPNSEAVTNLRAQLDQLSNYSPSILGWLGRDEPNSIDQYAPIKKVNEILNSYTYLPSRLWIPLMGRWNGLFNHPNDPHGTYRLSPWKEMKKRIGDMNVWQDIYYFDYPWCDTCTLSPPDWKSANIEVAAELNYKQAYELNPNFGVSLQCGEVHVPGIAEERNITDYEFLYETNLALMYGAKFLSLYSYFAHTDTADCSSGRVCHAIVDLIANSNELIYTPKYTMLRHTISPRLKGFFGRTIKRLTPTAQHLNIDASSYYNFISHFSGNLECLPSTSDYDLGFFTDSLSRDYFMLISRYYNQSGACPIYINFDESSLNNNLVLTKFAEDTTYNILRSDPIPVNLTRGDAELYRIYPVVRWGGQLLANDTIYTNTTLTDPMSISAGAKLFIKAGKFYTIQDTVILNGTGQQPNWGFITGDGYLDVAQCGEVIANNWAYSLFKGKQSNHPKLFWSKFTGNDHTGYKIYRKKETPGFVEIATLSNTARTYIDTTVVVIDGQSQSNEVVAEYYVKAIYDNGRSSSNSNTITYKRVEGSAWEKLSTGLTRDNFTYQLQQNYPNPFNPSTKISWQSPISGWQTIKLYDITGKEIDTIVDGYFEAGSHSKTYVVNLKLSSGIYFYKLTAGNFSETKKMVVLK